MPVCMTFAAIAASMPPAAPRVWPVIDLVDEIASLQACPPKRNTYTVGDREEADPDRPTSQSQSLPNTFLIAMVSNLSLYAVDVPCALM